MNDSGRTPGMTQLLDLPPELLQLILWHVTSSSYLQAAFSCRTLLNQASTCRPLILHHLEQIPGRNHEIYSLKTGDLFCLLSKRSSHQLYGAQFHASCKQFQFESKVIDVRASSFAKSGDPNLALAVRGEGIVDLYHVHNGELVHRGFLTPPWDPKWRVEVLKTAFDEQVGVYVLQRVKHDTIESVEGNSFTRHTSQMTYLVHYTLDSSQPMVRVCPLPQHGDCEPLAFAVAGRDAFAISWQWEDGKEIEVVLYTDLSDTFVDEKFPVMNMTYECSMLVSSRPGETGSPERLPVRTRPGERNSPVLSLSSRGSIVDLAFNDDATQILHYYPTQPTYGTWQRIDTMSPVILPKLYENECLVKFSESYSLLFSIEVPFFGTHRTYNQPNVEQDSNDISNAVPMCRWRYLSIGIAKHPREKWTVACLMKSQALCRAVNCSHVLNRDRGRRFPNWVIVARLWGFQEPSSSTGYILAASKQGTRVAAANWNAIYVWAVEANELLDDKSEFYPDCWKSNTGKVELRPIVLKLNAVCFKIRFLENEDHLVALTDHGIMYLDLGPLGKGARTLVTLPTNWE